MMIVLGDTIFEPGRSFVKKIMLDGCDEKMRITPLVANGKTQWYEIIFQNGEKRHIQQAAWGWKFMDRFPTLNDRDPDEVEGELLRAQDVGMAIEAHYGIE